MDQIRSLHLRREHNTDVLVQCYEPLSAPEAVARLQNVTEKNNEK